MKSDYDYQFPWRPIFELTAIAGWIGGAVLAYLTSRWSGLPREPFDWLIDLAGYPDKCGDFEEFKICN